MSEEPQCQIRRRRRSSGNSNLPLNLEVGSQTNMNEEDPNQGTPSPSYQKNASNYRQRPGTSALLEFRKKQQSFDIVEIEIEECEEEEIIIDSEDEAAGEESGRKPEADRPITPTPIQDYSANVDYTEGSQVTDFLTVRKIEQECYTDISEEETDEEK